MKMLEQSFKYWLTRIGAQCSPQTIHRLNGGINYLETGRWFNANNHDVSKRFKSRYRMFDLVAKEIADKRVLYLEFGVYQGKTLRYWSRLLTNPKAMLHGFDSFEGLPEKWSLRARKYDFTMNKKVPEFDDERVKFFIGWFEDTLPQYVVPEHEVLFITIDSDLFSSAVTVLHALKEQIRPGVYIYFDEFGDRAHEMKAFDEFLAETGMQCRVVAISKLLGKVLFQITES